MRPQSDRPEKELSTDEDLLIISKIEAIRQNGSIRDIPAVIELLLQTSSEAVKKAIRGLLGDITDIQAIPLFAEAIRNTSAPDIRLALVAACWQTPLDFSSFFDLFFDIFLVADFELALEAHTVIENSMEHLSREQLIGSCEKLESRLPLMEPLKQGIALDLHDFLKAGTH